MERKQVIMDGNQAAAYGAFKVNEVVAIYPITPSSPMGEWADEWATLGQKNIWGTIPLVQEMQSEGGAAGAVHGSLQTGALTTTFTASQGLLLMMPNMFKIAGELTSTVFHIAARSVATHALSIFGDHSDVMAVRSTGFAFLCSANIQEVLDNALIAQAATLESRVPFLHFFDGFRTSHEVAKIEQYTDEDIAAMIDENLVRAHRQRALSPDRPIIRGTAQNPDVFFQARETINHYYKACPEIVQKNFDKFAEITGRRYRIFDYYGAPDAEYVIVIMGSGAEAVYETVESLMKRGLKVGVLKVRLYRPFSIEHFIAALPRTTKVIATLDRTKEPGSNGEPLYLDVVNAVVESGVKDSIKIIGGRYGLSSKEFTPAMVKGLFGEMTKPKLKNHFTVGIVDDVSETSIDYDPNFTTEPEDVVRAVFYGLGSDGTVGANKNSIKIIGEGTKNHVQAYFVYDSKKAGAITVSHLRFGPRPIQSTYLIQSANFVGCHQPVFLEKYDVLKCALPGATFLLNSPYGQEEVWGKLPNQVQNQIIEKKLRFFVIDGYSVARQAGMGGRINTIMQTCFFAISGILPRDEAIQAIKSAIQKTYGKKGDSVVNMNFNAVDQALANLHEVKVPDKATSSIQMSPPVPEEAPDFVKKVTAKIIAGQGDELPVSAFLDDGTFPTGTTQWEKRNIAQEIPVWDENICIQCGKCAIVCPHAAIRLKVYDPKSLDGAPSTFKSTKARDREWQAFNCTVQVAPEDCTGCEVCVNFCPTKNKKDPQLKAINMQPQAALREQEKKNWEFFLEIPEFDRNLIKRHLVRQSQILQPLFEFSGACAGCGETPYLKLASQLFGDRMLVANATGCSSIYGGNLPTTPWTKNSDGRGPAWSNSLFEDNAEFGLGFRLAVDKQADMAAVLVKKLASKIGDDLAEEILEAKQDDETEIFEQRRRVEVLKKKLEGMTSPEAEQLLSVVDMLVKKSVWIIGGDGWAYDIGFGGLDHVLASGRDVNLLVLDTEVYSNTGGQMSKATPRAAVAKFAAGGKPIPKKDLARIVMTYGYVYVASVAMGARDDQTLKAFIEAERYKGPSLIIAYSHCIAHGINMTTGMNNQKAAVLSGHWPLFRYNPELTLLGKNPLILDSSAPKIPLEEYMYNETRYKMLCKSNPEEAKGLLKLAEQDVADRWATYAFLASRTFDGNGNKKTGEEKEKEKVSSC